MRREAIGCRMPCNIPRSRTEVLPCKRECLRPALVCTDGVYMPGVPRVYIGCYRVYLPRSGRYRILPATCRDRLSFPRRDELKGEMGGIKGPDAPVTYLARDSCSSPTLGEGQMSALVCIPARVHPTRDPGAHWGSRARARAREPCSEVLSVAGFSDIPARF